jgi:HK97 family phage portal protein
VFKWLANWRAEKRATFKDADGWFADWLIGGSKTVSGENVSPKVALEVVAYFAAMRAICEDIAKVPLILYTRLPNDGGKKRMAGHPTHRLLHDTPNPEMSAMSFRETLTQHAVNWGNGYAEIARAGARPAALWPIDPNRVTVKRDDDGRIIYEVRNVSNGGMKTLQMDDMFHLHGLGFDGLVGYPLSELARQDLGAALAAVKGSAATFGSGSRPGGLLKTTKKMEDIAVERLRQQWEAMYSGGENKHKTAILEEGMDFQAISAVNKDAQFLELQMYLVEVMARLLRVSPSKIGHNVHGRYSNTEQQAIDYVGDAIQPWAVRWEQEIQRKLILPSTEPNLFAEHLLDGLMRGDSAARSARQKALFFMGAITINEIRSQENMNPIDEGGDISWMQVNLQPMDKALEGPSEPAVPSMGTSNEEDEDDSFGDDRQAADAMAVSHRGLFVETYTRLLELEADKVGRASKRRGFAEWHSKFYANRADYVRRELITPVNTFCEAVWRGSGGGPMDDLVSEMVGTQTALMAERYVSRTKPALCAGVQDGWTPEEAASELVDQELDTLAELMARICGREAVTV